MRILSIFCFLAFFGCGESKWERIKGSGIDNESKSIDPIYFENLDTGVVGGYTLLVKDSQDQELESIPLLYVTQNGGKTWSQIHLDPALRGRITSVYLSNDSLISIKEDSLVLFSTDGGKTINYVRDSEDARNFKKKYFNFNRYQISNHDFYFKNVKYHVKERYQNKLSTVIVCRGSEILTDYYFVSFDNEQTWKYLQKDYGSVRDKFLFEDKYLFSYDFPFGLARLRLK